MPLPSTMTPIATITLNSDAASITFSSISSNYTDLVLVGRVGQTSASAAMGVRFNSDSGNNYSITEINGNGSTTSSSRANSQSYIFNFYSTVPNSSLNGFFVMNIMNYANTTTNKTVVSRQANPDSSYPGTSAVVGLWRSTAVITSITFASAPGVPTADLKSGSTFTLYGIKAAS